MGIADELKGKNYYEILNVSRDASTEVIKESYKEIAKIYHPDSNYYSDIIAEPLSPEQEEIFKIITAAYNTLISIEKRPQYDDSIKPSELRSWEDPDEFWDFRRDADKMQQSAQRGSRVRRPTGFGSVLRDLHQESLEDSDPVEPKTSVTLQYIVAGVIGALCITTGGYFLYLLFR